MICDLWLLLEISFLGVQVRKIIANYDTLGSIYVAPRPPSRETDMYSFKMFLLNGYVDLRHFRSTEHQQFLRALQLDFVAASKKLGLHLGNIPGLCKMSMTIPMPTLNSSSLDKIIMSYTGICKGELIQFRKIL